MRRVGGEIGDMCWALGHLDRPYLGSYRVIFGYLIMASVPIFPPCPIDERYLPGVRLRQEWICGLSVGRDQCFETLSEREGRVPDS